jgi:hypothetical protein
MVCEPGSEHERHALVTTNLVFLLPLSYLLFRVRSKHVILEILIIFGAMLASILHHLGDDEGRWCGAQYTGDPSTLYHFDFVMSFQIIPVVLTFAFKIDSGTKYDGESKDSGDINRVRMWICKAFIHIAALIMSLVMIFHYNVLDRDDAFEWFLIPVVILIGLTLLARLTAFNKNWKQNVQEIFFKGRYSYGLLYTSLALVFIILAVSFKIVGDVKSYDTRVGYGTGHCLWHVFAALSVYCAMHITDNTPSLFSHMSTKDFEQMTFSGADGGGGEVEAQPF